MAIEFGMKERIIRITIWTFEQLQIWNTKFGQIGLITRIVD